MIETIGRILVLIVIAAAFWLAWVIF